MSSYIEHNVGASKNKGFKKKQLKIIEPKGWCLCCRRKNDQCSNRIEAVNIQNCCHGKTQYGEDFEKKDIVEKLSNNNKKHKIFISLYATKNVTHLHGNNLECVSNYALKNCLAFFLYIYM